MPSQIYYSDLPVPPALHAINATHINASVSLPNGVVLEFATLSMLSISTHREKFPVTRLGTAGPVAFTSGHRMVAGTLVFSIVDKGAFVQLMNPLESVSRYVSKSDQQSQNSRQSKAFYDMKADELPPFDIRIIYATPEGLVSYEALEGVTILDEGSVRSMDMLSISESYSYMARNRVPLQHLEILPPSSVPTAYPAGKGA